jgi:hypothetical protein
MSDVVFVGAMQSIFIGALVTLGIVVIVEILRR